ncbi:tail fiber protein [Marinomonas sp. M1K-6]|uniref:Tail fiber protein n=1 Tax=Marinomonas profundi TaxID=2726122 RepID=A0A847RAF3_9GAMM|nr:tail fiber protein [Marinomonas profundi]NLQ17934.1 tail fiber protein [Marinomonas profundi]UDV03412.1 tail fiber protein [Marinomonas profundi]
MKKTLLAAALFGSAFWGQAAYACSDEPYIGSVCAMAINYCPDGYLEANGASLHFSQYQALYSLLGVTYGGSQANGTFQLPDLRSRTVIGKGQGSSLSAYPLGAKIGSETYTLNQMQMPTHNHSATFTPSGGSSGGGTASGIVTLPVTGSAKIAAAAATSSSTPSNNSVLGIASGPAAKIYADPGTTADLNIGPAGAVTGTATGPVTLNVTGGAGSGGTVAVGATGGSQAFPLLGPRIALTYCIAVQGIYPVNPN